MLRTEDHTDHSIRTLIFMFYNIGDPFGYSQVKKLITSIWRVQILCTVQNMSKIFSG